MFKRESDEQAFEAMVEAEIAREAETKQKLAELIAKRKVEKVEGSTRTRGHATRVLRTQVDALRAMLPVFTLSEMVDLLAEAGIHVNYHSLRNFLIKHMPEEYRDFVAIGQGKGGFAPIPDHLRDAPMTDEEFGVTGPDDGGQPVEKVESSERK